MSNSLNPIEVTVRDARKAIDLLRGSSISFEQDGSTIFILENEEDWNSTMELFEDNNIELY